MEPSRYMTATNAEWLIFVVVAGTITGFIGGSSRDFTFVTLYPKFVPSKFELDAYLARRLCRTAHGYD